MTGWIDGFPAALPQPSWQDKASPHPCLLLFYGVSCGGTWEGLIRGEWMGGMALMSHWESSLRVLICPSLGATVLPGDWAHCLVLAL